jgi:hypothetical protein
MQIPRHLLLTCAVAACLIPTLVHAADNEAQIRARQALEEKMKEMPAPAAPTNPPPAMSKPTAAKQKPAPPVVTVTPQETTEESQLAPAKRPDAATRQKLEDALHQTTSAPQPAVQEPPQQPAMTATPNAAPVQSQPSQPAQAIPSNDEATRQKLENALNQPTQQPANQQPVTQQPAQPSQSMPSYISTPSNDQGTSQKLEQALRQKMQQTPAEPTAPAMATQKPAGTMPAPTQAPTANYAPVPATTTAHPNLPETRTPTPPASVANRNQPAPPVMSLPALSGPATGLSAAKEQKLNELLNQYRADQITPQQYHEQRAKILAEP